MSLDYFIMAFIACCGVYQIASIPARLEGLWFFGSPRVQYFFGIMAIIGAIGWFFTNEERNIQHTVEGSEQLALFLAAILSSYIVTVVLASIIQAKEDSSEYKDAADNDRSEKGLEEMKNTTILNSIRKRLSKRMKVKN